MIGLRFERAFVFVFAVVPCFVAVGVRFLVEVETYMKIDALDFGIEMEAGIAGARERPHEAHFAVILVLERVAGAPKQCGRVFFDGFDLKFHSGSGGASANSCFSGYGYFSAEKFLKTRPVGLRGLLKNNRSHLLRFD